MAHLVGHGLDLGGVEVGGGVELRAGRVIRIGAEHAVGDEHVEMQVAVEGIAEAVDEEDGAELGVPGSTGARLAECGLDQAQEDLGETVDHGGVVLEVPAHALGDGEDATGGRGAPGVDSLFPPRSRP